MARSQSEYAKFIRLALDRAFWIDVEAFGHSDASTEQKETWVCSQFADRTPAEQANGIAQVLNRPEAIIRVCKNLKLAPLSIALVDAEPVRMSRALGLAKADHWLCEMMQEAGLWLSQNGGWNCTELERPDDAPFRYPNADDPIPEVRPRSLGVGLRGFPAALSREGETGCSSLGLEETGNSIYIPGGLRLEGWYVAALPRKLWVGGSLCLGGCQVESLPDDLQVERDLDLTEAKIQALPEGLSLLGSLVLERSTLAVLPASLTVRDSLRLTGSRITHVPGTVSVGGDLDLRNMDTITLGDGLVVGLGPEQGGRNNARLRLEGSGIASLPQGLVVHGALEVQETPLAALPDDLKVTWRIALAGTRVHELPESCAGVSCTGLMVNRRRDRGTIRAFPPAIVAKYLDMGRFPAKVAASGRAGCRLCGETIAKGESALCLDASVGSPFPMNPKAWLPQGSNYFHPDCWQRAELPLTGAQELKPSEQSGGDQADPAPDSLGMPVDTRTAPPADDWQTALRMAESVPAAAEKAKLVAPFCAEARVEAILGWCESQGLHPLSLLAHMDERKTYGRKFGVAETLLDCLQRSEKGSLTFKGSDLEVFPAGLKLTGDLRIQAFPCMDALPADLEIGGALILRETGLSCLPEGLQVPGYLGVYNCPKLTALPEGMILGGNVHVSNTPLERMPERMVLQGDLDLRGCRTIQNLPKILSVGGNLDLGGTGIQVLPEHLEVGGSLALWGTRGWKDLPLGLPRPDNGERGFFGSLDISGTEVETLPVGLVVAGTLSCNGCAGLRSLPDGLVVGGDLNLSRTPIAGLPSGLVVAGSIDVSGCSNLTELPLGLRVSGDLNLSGSGLRCLPEGLEVSGRLHLEDLPNLPGLPADGGGGEDLFQSGPSIPIPPMTNSEEIECEMDGFVSEGENIALFFPVKVGQTDLIIDSERKCAMGTKNVTSCLERLEAIEDRLGVELSGLDAVYDDGTLRVRGEISTKGGGVLKHHLHVVVATYNSDGQVTGTNDTFLNCDKFCGFDVFDIGVYDCPTNIKKIRVWPKLG
jgi:hypothetical protein